MKKAEGVKTWRLPVRAVDRAIFNAIKSGRKSIETRALNNPKGARYYGDITRGDKVVVACGQSKCVKRVKRVAKYKSIAAMLRKEPYRKIDARFDSIAAAEKVYFAFPNYKERIKKFGLIAFELE
jgi:ASC-1-like (ASCH) protein